MVDDICKGKINMKAKIEIDLDNKEFGNPAQDGGAEMVGRLEDVLHRIFMNAEANRAVNVGDYVVVQDAKGNVIARMDLVPDRFEHHRYIDGSESRQPSIGR